MPQPGEPRCRAVVRAPIADTLTHPWTAGRTAGVSRPLARRSDAFRHFPSAAKEPLSHA